MDGCSIAGAEIAGGYSNVSERAVVLPAAVRFGT
jgi:hypothetical protein